MRKLMQIVRAHFLVKGKVQRVYFRATAQTQALALHLTGWVRNCPDGNVEGIIEGKKTDVDKMLVWCRQGPPDAVVEELEINLGTCQNKFSTFIIAPDRE